MDGLMERDMDKCINIVIVADHGTHLLHKLYYFYSM